MSKNYWLCTIESQYMSHTPRSLGNEPARFTGGCLTPAVESPQEFLLEAESWKTVSEDNVGRTGEGWQRGFLLWVPGPL